MDYKDAGGESKPRTEKYRIVLYKSIPRTFITLWVLTRHSWVNLFKALSEFRSFTCTTMNINRRQLSRPSMLFSPNSTPNSKFIWFIWPKLTAPTMVLLARFYNQANSSSMCQLNLSLNPFIYRPAGEHVRN